ncbi:uncharacterized protein LOC130687505 [Daphnia carinata]|uniref:uncharacterized protein LOC130687505 n=1 Tax=Daphnia carinata TaxID=120202 RepID=UPI00257F870C|nr:uncharacterized protein LOC130687505 [Daphnia carinata]
MVSIRDIRNPYSVLIEDVVKLHLAALTEKELKDVVEHFRDQIQSNRVICYIKDIYSLVTVLEARNVLNSQNVDALLDIAKLINRPLAAQRIQDYKKHRELVMHPPLPKLAPSSPSSPPCIETSHQISREKLIDKVFAEIAKLLGRDVSSFARALPFDLSESELQHLRSQSRDNLEEATLKVLKLFRERNPNIDHIQSVMQALNVIKRSEIRRKIEVILSANARCS